MLDPAVPPVFAGYPADDRSAWPEFRAEYRRSHGEMWAAFDDFVRGAGAAGLPDTPEGPAFIHESPSLNLYLYPAEADYQRAAPLAPTWHRLDSCVRATDGEWTLPDELAAGEDGGALIYLSLGSLGSADVDLMRRLVDVLGRTRHRFVVSKGPQHDQYDLAANMVGAEFLPQPAILPQVDLVITHGLPLFWDQYDNAQRVDELGFGVRLQTYEFAEAEMDAAIDRLLADDALRSRMTGIADRLQASPGTVRAADLIERLARTAAPVSATGR
jgi:UDP:flavonoid glycosyltransferase YjiC (YdhE family)